MKKFLTFLLTLAMVVSMLPAAAFAANNTATTMRLAKTQGTVAVTNATGKKVPQTANMKLYNGYKIRTGAKSYAWISLDDTKAAKLDANSVVSVQKSGQKLTLYLSSGNLFFNVKEKLSGGESFHIKTSTMTTGIRGTSGCVRVINPRVTEIHLLTGQIEVYTENPELHISKTAVLTAGQKATSLIAEDAVAATGEQADIIIEKLTHDEVCGNCSKEIAADPELVERIKEEAPHLLPEKIADEADERLEADEAAAEEKQEAIEKAVDEQTLPEDVDPYFEKEEAGGSGGGGGGGGSSAPVNPSTTVQVSTWGELVQAVNDYNAGTDDITIEVVAEIDQGTETTTVTVNPTANGNTLTIDLTTAGITMNSTIVNNGNLVVTNTAGHIITEAATVVENNGTFTLDDGTLQTVDFENGVAVINNGDFEMIGGRIMGSYDNNHEFASYCGVMNDGTFTMSAGTIDTVGYAIINGENTAADLIILGGDIAPLLGVQNISGTATVADGTLDGTFYNEDELNIQGGIWTASYGAIVENENTGTLTMDGGTMHVSVSNGYGVNNSGTATISDGDIYVNVGATGSVGVASSGTLVMDGGAAIRAYEGTGVNGTGGLVTLDTGAVVFAYNEALAVNVAGATLTRPVGATVAAAHFIDENDQKVMNPYDQYMNVAQLDSAEGGRLYQLVDTYGQAVPSTIDTWAELVAAVDEFNALDGNGQTVTLTLGASIPAATETNPETMDFIASGNKHLVIDLNNRRLTLPQTITVDGNLNLVGGGVIDSTVTGTGAKLFDVRSTGSIGMDSSTSGAPTIDVAMNQIAFNVTESTVTMNAGSIDIGNIPSTGIIAYGGHVYMNGGEIRIMACGDNFANMGIQAFDGTTVRMAGGTIKEGDGIVDATNDNNYAIYADDSTVELADGTVSVHNGAAIRVTDPSQLTLGSAVVTGKDAAKLLVVPEGVEETGFTTEAADTAGYSELITTTTSNIIPVGNADEIVAAFATVNSKATAYIIQMTDNINMEPYDNGNGEMLAYTPLEVMSTTDTTLDLNGKTLTLGNTLTNAGTLTVTDSDTGGNITGIGSTLVTNSGTLTWDYGNMTVSKANGVGLENSGTAELGNGSQNNATIINVTGANAKGIQVTEGKVTIDGMQIETTASQTQTGILVDSDAELIVDRATIYAASGNTGIENNGTTELNGASLSARSGNTGTLVKNVGILTMNDGTLVTDTGAAVDMSGGTFTMTDGEIRTTSYYNAAVRLIGGEATLEGGEIIVNSNGGGEKGVSVAAAARLTLDGGTITVNGHSSNANYKNYGIYDTGGTLNINSGVVKAVISAAVAGTGTGNAYAMYTSTGAWDNLTMPNDDVYDRPAAEICTTMEGLVYLMNPAPDGVYGYSYDDTEELYYLWNVN